MPDSPTKIYDLAAAVLATVEAHYLAEGFTLPDRRYVSSGSVAYDCEQVVVSLVRMFPGIPFREDPASPVLKATLLRGIELAVHVVRCIPTIKQGRTEAVWPTPGELETSGAELLTDAYLLPTGIVKAWHAGTLSSACDELGIGQLVPAEPEGGFGGSILTLQAQF